jgi:hypothetical protein
VPLGGRLNVLWLSAPGGALVPAGPADAARARETIAALEQALASLDPADDTVRRARVVLDVASEKAGDLDLMARYPELAVAVQAHYDWLNRGGPAPNTRDLLAPRDAIANRPGVPDADRAGILDDIQSVLDGS